MSEIIEAINKAWGWKNFTAVELIDENEFGNLIFRTSDNAYWRMIPETPDCYKIAENEEALLELRKNDEFILDWEMKNMVVAAKRKLGKLEPGKKFCFKMLELLNGSYNVDNIGVISQLEQIDFSGDMAEQLDKLPDGTKVRINFED